MIPDSLGSHLVCRVNIAAGTGNSSRSYETLSEALLQTGHPYGIAALKSAFAIHLN